MYILWIVVSVILGLLWLIVSGIGVASLIDGEWNREQFKAFSAVMAGALIIVLFHWIVLLLAVPAFFAYGLFQAIKLGVKRLRNKPLTPTD